jgi:hypothetical protein
MLPSQGPGFTISIYLLLSNNYGSLEERRDLDESRQDPASWVSDFKEEVTEKEL